MALEIVEGSVESLRPGEKYVEGVVDGIPVRIPAALADKVAQGEAVKLVGMGRGETLEVLAVENRSRGLRAHLDVTNYMLLGGVAGFVGLFCGVLAVRLQGAGEPLWQNVNAGLSVLGFLVLFWMAGKIIAITRASTYVSL